MPVDWEGWLFIAACSNLALKLLHQITLGFLGGMEEVSYNYISVRLTQWQEQILKDFKISELTYQEDACIICLKQNEEWLITVTSKGFENAHLCWD